ncbi:ComEC/Rec2 family competence protein [Algoriphagus confluentis]|uniref:Competence protein ComEC n=1 Tax=Algoriphagus confluentis TaxID=1697556 RepID=A0ABQ6PQX7_9BACT|nr:hypothetical protein Aconfl_30080 [Algoriphagus confluentis]
MRFGDFPFLRYLPFLIAGILLGKILPFQLLFAPALVLLESIWVVYLIFLFKKNSGFRPPFALLAYIQLILTGFALSLWNQKSNPEPLNSFSPEVLGYLAEAQKFDADKPSSRENLMRILAIRDSSGWKKGEGKVLVYHQDTVRISPGDLVFISKTPEMIEPPEFPNEFDYRDFLAKKGINYRQFIGKNFKILDALPIGSGRFAKDRLRDSFSQLIKTKVSSASSQQIAQALLLGQKENLDKTLRNSYAETGTMHILAVSGLHVGIIYLVLLFPLRLIKLKGKPEKMYLIAVIAIIWIYAALTGLSPSVVRASTMFSLFSVGQMRQRRPSIWNILAFSAMIMIAWDPDVLFEIGFQLSYAAVAGIVGLQPLIVRWWLPPNRILEYFWQLAAVSIAAQLATFPLSVYYFHLFPTYFLFANLLVVPLAFLIMAVGLPFLAFGWIEGIGEVLGWTIDQLIRIQIWVAEGFQSFPIGSFDRLTISISGMLLVWMVLLIWGNWEWGDRRKLTALLIFAWAFWIADGLVLEWSKPSRSLWVFSGKKGLLFELQSGSQTLVWNQSFPPDQLGFAIDPNRIQEGRSCYPGSLKTTHIDSIFSVPGYGFSFSPDQKRIFWNGEKPRSIRYFKGMEEKSDQISTGSSFEESSFQVIF